MFFLVFKVAVACLESIRIVHQAIREILEAVHVKTWKRTDSNNCALFERVCAFFLPIVSFPHMVKVKWVEKVADFRVTESQSS